MISANPVRGKAWAARVQGHASGAAITRPRAATVWTWPMSAVVASSERAACSASAGAGASRAARLGARSCWRSTFEPNATTSAITPAGNTTRCRGRSSGRSSTTAAAAGGGVVRTARAGCGYSIARPVLDALPAGTAIGSGTASSGSHTTTDYCGAPIGCLARRGVRTAAAVTRTNPRGCTGGHSTDCVTTPRPLLKRPLISVPADYSPGSAGGVAISERRRLRNPKGGPCR